MDPLLLVSLALIVAIIALVMTIGSYRAKIAQMETDLQAATSQRQSLASTYGRITEQWAPFMAGYPYEPRRFRFLGSPIDGVQFEDDKVVFVEFKTNTSRLSAGEQRIKENVQAGRVEWFEFRVEEKVGAPPAPAESFAPPSGYWPPPESR